MTIFILLFFYYCLYSLPAKAELKQSEAELITEMKKGLRIKNILLTGNTVLTEEERNKIFNNWIGKPANDETYAKIKNEIEKLYAQKGYSTSGVVFSNFSENLKQLTIQIVEGKIEEVEIIGLKNLSKDFILKRLEITQPYNEQILLRSAEVLRLSPLLQEIEIERIQGTKVGLSKLIVNLKEAKSFKGNVFFSNDSPETIGEFKRGFNISKSSLFDSGDRFSFTLFNTEGNTNFNANYSNILNAKDTQITFSVGRGLANVTGSGLDVLDIEFDSWYAVVGLSHPLERSKTGGTFIGCSYVIQNSTSTLSDELFRLNLGADSKGRTRLRPLICFGNWIRNTPKDSIQIIPSIHFGTSLFGGTINELGPDSRYFYFSNNLAWRHRLNNNFFTITRAKMQLTPMEIPSEERFKLAGFSVVRGYPEASLFADNGIFLSAEGRWKILEIEKINTSLTLAPFIDFASGWDTIDLNLDPSTIASTGIGLLIINEDFLTAGFYYAIPLTRTEEKQNFSVIFNFSF
ncbi:MAG: ShlB/FhaC/HecB family hemolysin secretion/activation protein [Prochloraceae cyanobacterium]